MSEPKVKSDSFWADLANALMLRPVYRRPAATAVGVPKGYYGGEMTWHSGGEVNVELDASGRVVSVWFRCASLPFTQSVVGAERAEMMERMYSERVPESIEAIVFRRDRAE
jgi:hypothetical protein